MDPENTADSGIDMDAAVSDIANGLGIDISDEAPEIDEEGADPEIASDEADTDPVATEEIVAAPVAREMPKSWSKDKTELWSKLPPDAQDYYGLREKQFLDGLEQYKGDATYARELKDVVAPYKALLASQGVTEQQAVKSLLNAHYRLSSGTFEERKAAYEQIGRDIGVVQQSANPEQPVDPVLQNLQKELQSVKSALTARQQAELAQAQASADREIEAFASDPANAYFNDVGQDMIALLRAGKDLKTAYDQAVWANPVTRQKELNRLQTEEAAKLTQKAKAEGAIAKKATSSNVRAVESRKAPTEPKGEFLSNASMEADLAAIRKRNH